MANIRGEGSSTPNPKPPTRAEKPGAAGAVERTTGAQPSSAKPATPEQPAHAQPVSAQPKPGAPAPAKAAQAKQAPAPASSVRSTSGQTAGTAARPGVDEKNAKPASERSSSASFEQVQLRAYELYVERGCEDGHADEDWRRAEAELSGARRGGSPSA